MNWKRTGKTVNERGTVIKYSREDLEGVTIESRKIQQPHANGIGFWWYTSYFVVTDDGTEKEYHSLRDAKEAAEKIGGKDGFL